MQSVLVVLAVCTQHYDQNHSSDNNISLNHLHANSEHHKRLLQTTDTDRSAKTADVVIKARKHHKDYALDMPVK